MRFPLFACLVLVPTTALAFEGNYANREPGFEQLASIVQRPNGTYAVKLEVTTPRCVGAWEATGHVAGEVLLVETKGEGECSVAIRRTAIGINVKEFTCGMHGHRCDFEGYYTRVTGTGAATAPPLAAAPAPTPPPTAAIGGRFACADEINLEPARRADPNYRLPPIQSGKALAVGYDYYYDHGAFAYSLGGDTTTYRDVRVAIAGDTAVYTAPRGARWTVRPVGGRNVTIRGTGITGSVKAFACSWR